MLLTPRSQGSRHGRLGHVPKLFDSWIADGAGGKWQDIRVSTFIIHNNEKNDPYQNTILACCCTTSLREAETQRFR